MKFFACLLILLLPSAQAAITSGTVVEAAGTIEQWGIIWTFDKQLTTDGAGDTYQYGTFANGDFWVVGSCNLSQIQVENESEEIVTAGVEVGGNDYHGCMINPPTGDDQGYCESALDYNVNLNVALGVDPCSPLTLDAGDSLVSSISLDAIDRAATEGSWVKTMAVLTVLAAASDNTKFRPPYAGTTKTIYDSDDLDTALLTGVVTMATYSDDSFSIEQDNGDPWSTPVSGTRAQQYAVYYQRMHNFSKINWRSESTRPVDNCNTYYREAHVMDGDAAILLLSDDANVNELLIPYVQTGIDAYFAIADRATWTLRGDRCFSKSLIVISGALLEVAAMQSSIPYFDDTYGLSVFKEDYTTYFGEDNFTTPGTTTYCWTDWHLNAHDYATNVLYRHGNPGNEVSPAFNEYEEEAWTIESPPSFGHADLPNADNYRHTSHSWTWVASAIAIRLFGLVDEWDHAPFFAYIDRWMYEDDSAWWDLGHSIGGWHVRQGDVLRSSFARDVFLDHRGSVEGDLVAPTPSPLTWATEPEDGGGNTIDMVATTATDVSDDVEYYFEELSGNTGGDDSAWQDSASYTDEGIDGGETYIYRTRARDKSINQNATAWSTNESFPVDSTAPTPNPATWLLEPSAVSDSEIEMTATTASDQSDVEYYFDETTEGAGATDSGWQDGVNYSDTGLTGEVNYTYRVRSRDKSSGQNTTTWSASKSVRTNEIPRYIGNTTVFGSFYAGANRRAMPFTMNEDGSIQSISMYHGGGSGDLFFAVYDTSGGLPNARLGISAQTAVNGAAGWQTVNMIEAATADKDDVIWLAWVYETPPNLYYENSTPARADIAETWSSGMPTSFGTSTQPGSGASYSIFATYLSPVEASNALVGLRGRYSGGSARSRYSGGGRHGN